MIIKYNNKIVTKSHKWCSSTGATPIPPGPGPGPEPDPYNPLNLPAGTIRVRTSDGNVPRKGIYTEYETATLVPGTTDVYDVYKSGTSFADLFYQSENITEVLGANTTGITNMNKMFFRCYSLASVALFDTSKVTNMGGMFQSCSLTTVPLFDTSNVTHIASMFMVCSSLKSAPLFDTSNVKNMNYMFYGCSSLTNVPLLNTSKVTDMDQVFLACRKVESGALALYQQASTQATPPRNHVSTFEGCGADTVTGAAELAQIRQSWGGTKPLGS